MAVLFLFAVFVLSAGFAKLMAMWVNWICAHRIAKKLVVADKGLNLGLIVAYPVLLLYGLGWHGPGLLTGGSSWHFDAVWWLPIALGAIGFVLLIAATIGNRRYRPPPCELSVASTIVDLRNGTYGQSWRTVFVGKRGRKRRVALLPGNEQFTIDVSTKAYQLPRLPAHWDGLTIVHLSDLHFYGGVTRAYFEIVCDQAAALRPDIFVFSGDLLDNQARLDWLPETLGRLQAPLGKFFVLGNHDWYLDPDATRLALVRLGWTDLSRGFVNLASPNRPEGSPLLLCGDETPWMGDHADLTGAPVDAFRILVSHTPDNITWARKQRIGLMLSGHTHGGQIRLPILGPVYSPSVFGCRFASGVFWLDPTLMYVSRGISGRDPIRYNCPPEVTKLLLKSGESGHTTPAGMAR